MESLDEWLVMDLREGLYRNGRQPYCLHWVIEHSDEMALGVLHV